VHSSSKLLKASFFWRVFVIARRRCAPPPTTYQPAKRGVLPDRVYEAVSVGVCPRKWQAALC